MLETIKLQQEHYSVTWTSNLMFQQMEKNLSIFESHELEILQPIAF
jgi:hypothetical protein